MPDWMQPEPFDLVVIGMAGAFAVLIFGASVRRRFRQWRVRRLIRRWRTL